MHMMHKKGAFYACQRCPEGVYFFRGGTTVAKKLHVEIMPANWHRMKDYITSYNADLRRVTPRYKPADVINLALSQYLKGRKA
jgi:hypothetical protein